MKLTEKYVAEQTDCVQRNLEGYKNYKTNVCTQMRIGVTKQFCEGKEKILSVGCGAFEPIFLKATHALDATPVSGELLKQQGWQGEFRQGSCDELPYPDKFFDVAVCSEVLEHLPDDEMIARTFREVDRVAKTWIFTTPDESKCRYWTQDKSHLQFWNREQLLQKVPKEVAASASVGGLSIFTFVWKGQTPSYLQSPMSLRAPALCKREGQRPSA